MAPARLAVLAWSSHSGRVEELAAALGGEARCYYSLGLAAPAAKPLRHGLDAARTVAYLARRRPRIVVVTNPPIWLPLLVSAYARLRGADVVLDSHPGSFGLKGNRAGQRWLWLHRLLARRALRVMVASEPLAARVRSFGGVPLVLGEAPPPWSVPPPRPLAGGRPQVLFVGLFAADEPVAAVVAAARTLPELDVVAAGRLRPAARAALGALPPNVRLTGFLTGDAYVRELAHADLVLGLTDEPSSVLRVGHEAVHALRPLVVSDTPALRAAFPEAVHAQGDVAGIAAALRTAVARHAELVAAAPAARGAQEQRSAAQLDELRAAFPDTSGSGRA